MNIYYVEHKDSKGIVCNSVMDINVKDFEGRGYTLARCVSFV